jgi:2-Cys peroxiredoxin 5
MNSNLHIKVGQRVPPAFVAELDENGAVRSINTEVLFGGSKALVIGVPGAFTPICSSKHLPPFIASADSFRIAGFQELICISPSDPFAMEAWQRQIDPERKLRFISDGNLTFTRAAGLVSREPSLFLGERCKRFSMVVEWAVIRRLHVEDSVLDVSCTRAQDVLEFE